MSTISSPGLVSWESLKPAPVKSWNWYGAASGAINYWAAGALIGGAAGCVAGAIITAGAAAVACMVYGASGVVAGKWIGAGTGFYLGGTNSSHADNFDWLPNGTINPWAVK